MSTPNESELARLSEPGQFTELGRETQQLRDSELARLTELERWGSIQHYVPYGGIIIGTILTLAVRLDAGRAAPVGAGAAPGAARGGPAA